MYVSNIDFNIIYILIDKIKLNIIINQKSDELRHAEEELNAEIAHILHSVKIKDLIIDFSCVNLIDSMGVEAIENVS